MNDQQYLVYVAKNSAEFRSVWKLLAGVGLCDEVDGAEYERCLWEWFGEQLPKPVGPWIIAKANLSAPDLFDEDEARDVAVELAKLRNGGAV